MRRQPEGDPRRNFFYAGAYPKIYGGRDERFAQQRKLTASSVKSSGLVEPMQIRGGAQWEAPGISHLGEFFKTAKEFEHC